VLSIQISRLIGREGLCPEALGVPSSACTKVGDLRHSSPKSVPGHPITRINALNPRAPAEGPRTGGVLDPSTPALKALATVPRSTPALLRIHTGAAFPISQDCLPSSADVLTCGQRVRGVSLEEQSRCCIIFA